MTTSMGQAVPIEHPPEDLELMSAAHRYRRWVFELIRPHVGRHILEVGAGIGNYSAFLAEYGSLVALEKGPTLAAALRRQFAGAPDVRVVEHDIVDPEVQALGTGAFDTVVCLDVLEHIEDDARALGHMHALLADGGTLILKVPALPALYGTIDRALGHERRYRAGQLRRLVAEAGFVDPELSYMNMIGAVGWWINGRVWRRTAQSPAQIRTFERMVPLIQRLERKWAPPFGQSLVIVCRKAAAA
jgi:SAM-dependent methyltransferase